MLIKIKSTWLGRGVSQKSMLGPQGGGGQKSPKNSPHGLSMTPRYVCFIKGEKMNGNDGNVRHVEHL